MSDNGNSPEAVAAAPPKRRRASWPLIVIAGLFIIVPFLTWYGTWFGRGLSDDEIAKYLADEKNPRHIQHALSRIEERIEKGDPQARKFYPQIIALTQSPTGEIRKTAAWVMGQDNSSEDFHRALVGLLSDADPLVRRNAALQLVRFGDNGGRLELGAMLQPFEVTSPFAGSVSSLLAEGAKVKAGGLIARIRDASGMVQEFRSPVDGAIAKHNITEGQAVTVGQPLALLTPDLATIKDALRGLAYVGTQDDFPLIEPYTKSSDAEVSKLAVASIRAIQGRGDPKK